MTMRHWIVFVLLAPWILIMADPVLPKYVNTEDAKQIYDIFQQGEKYKADLQKDKDRILTHFMAFRGEDDTALYRVAGVRLEDFLAFQSLVFGMINTYAHTVYHTGGRGSTYDFRTPALRLTRDFQLTIKESHQRLQSDTLGLWDLTTAGTPQDLTYKPHQDEDNSMVELLRSMIEDVRESADQLEDEMRSQNLVFAKSDSPGQMETVLRLEHHARAGSGEAASQLGWLVDQDNNEYIMTRPSDTTVLHEDMQLLHDLILIVVSSFFFGWLFSLAKLPAFFGYMFAGTLTGPPGYNLVKEYIQMETLAQLGVMFIIFVLGIEFSRERLKSTWRIAAGGAATILVVIVIVFSLVGLFIQADVKESAFVGACISLSSTTVVSKVIKIDGLEQIYGLLVMQDVLLGLILALVPALAKPGIQIVLAILSSGASLTIFGGLCFTLLRLLPILLRWAGRWLPNRSPPYSHELVILGSIAICMSMLLLSEYLGLGFELGCFAAGVLIRSRKELYESVLTAVEPVKDFFACLFFASIGSHIYPSFLASQAVPVLLMATAVIGFKYLVTSAVLVSFGCSLRKSSATAIALAQVSEFCFVLASRAKQLDIISREVYYLLLAVTSLTLLATPLLWTIKDKYEGSRNPTPDLSLHTYTSREGSSFSDEHRSNVNMTGKIA